MKKIFLLAAITLFGLASCDLTEMPVTATDTDKALATFDGLNNATAVVYANLRGEEWYGSYTSIMPDVMGGNCVAGDPINTGRGGMFNNWNFTANGGWSIWSYAYTTILQCNNVIFQIKNHRDTYLAEEGVTEQDLDNIMAECLFMRAFSYFDLVRWYSKAYNPATAITDLGVPIANEDRNISAVEQPARATLAENYSNIVKDLTDARSLMSKSYIRAGVKDNTATCTYYVIEALLARVYLYMKDYPNAEAMATSVISSGKYAVADETQFVSMWTEPIWSGTPEIIFSAYVALGESATSPGMVTSPNEYGDIRVSKDYIDILEPQDVRFTMLQTSAKYSEYYWPAKYMGKGDGQVSYSSIAIIRTSEMYLIRAEALNKQGKDGTADLNMVATNRGATAYVAATEDNIFKENRKEFAFEGHIYHDYKRFGKDLDRTDVNATNNVDLPADSYLWLMPISLSELEVNENLKQNDGYEDQ